MILPKPQLPENATDKDRTAFDQQYDKYVESIMSAAPHELNAEHQKDLGRAIAAVLPDIHAKRA